MGVSWKDLPEDAQQRMYDHASPEAQAAIDAARTVKPAKAPKAQAAIPTAATAPAKITHKPKPTGTPSATPANPAKEPVDANGGHMNTVMSVLNGLTAGMYHGTMKRRRFGN